MELQRDGRGYEHANGGPAPIGRRLPSRSVEIRRFRVGQALKAVEDALILLDGERAIGVQTLALERIRDDLAVVLRLAETDCR
jgi:hypothetical protein